MEGELDPFRFEAMTLDGGTLDTGELVDQRPVAFLGMGSLVPDVQPRGADRRRGRRAFR